MLLIISFFAGGGAFSYLSGSWERWGGGGLMLDGKAIYESDFWGIEGGTFIAKEIYEKGDSSTAFMRWNLSISPYISIPIPWKIKLGIDLGWNYLWNWKYQDPDTDSFLPYPYSLRLVGHSLWMGTNFPLTPTIDLDLKIGTENIHGLKYYGGIKFCVGINYHEVLQPHLIVGAKFTDRKGNGNGYLDAGEKGEILLTIHNRGNAPARFIKLNVKLPYELQKKIALNSPIIPLLLPSRKITVSIKLNASENIPEGTYYVKTVSYTHLTLPTICSV